jgi:tRNA1Val (adenine37-N6)-methyltransferase
MKVGTDAILLAILAPIDNIARILEIGTGCGIIALILAQRSNALIDAIEIDYPSFEQARKNAINSPWNDRVKLQNISLQEFALSTALKYDLIISNPPYFNKSLKSPETRKNIARHDITLNFRELLASSLKLMKSTSVLSVILPKPESISFIDEAKESGLFPIRRINIISKEGLQPNRIILELMKNETNQIKEEHLAIRRSDGQYSDEYKELTKDLYIDF